MTSTSFPVQQLSAQPLLASSPRNNDGPNSRAFHICALKLWYFLYFGAQYTQLFIPLILRSLMQFPPATIGTLMSVRRILVFLSAPLFATLCDLSKAHRPLIIATLLFYYACSAILSQVQSLSLVAITLFTRDAFLAGVEPALNTATLAKLNQGGDHEESRISFGDVRSWGSLGWGIMAFAVPFSCTRLFPLHPYQAMLFTQVALGVFVVAVTAFAVDLDKQLFRNCSTSLPVSHVDDIDEEGSVAFNNDHCTTASTDINRNAGLTADVKLCVVATCCQGIVLGCIQTTLFLHLSELKVSSATMGLSTFIASLFEALFFSFGEKCRRAFTQNNTFSNDHHQHIAGIRIALSMNAIMLVVYVSLSALSNYRVVIVMLFLASSLSGTCSALFISNAITIASLCAPKQWQTRAQGLIQSTLYGIGPAVGAMLSGFCMQRFGIGPLYAVLAIADLTLATLFN